MEYISAKELFFKSRRFDLIYKLLFLEHLNDETNISSYYKELYLESIKVFNGFFEDEPRKEGESDFIKSFVNTLNKIEKEGYSTDYPIPVNNELQLYDGAHRLSIATYLNIDVPIKYIDHSDCFDYKFFKRHKINQELADIGALEYVRHNPRAHIVQVFPIVGKKIESFIESVLNEYGFIYYQKQFPITYNGIVRIKRINYGTETWAGSKENDYAGLKGHALNCLGYNKMRVYVFVCDSIEDSIKAKTKIRNRINQGNYPIHINDTHEEAEKLSNIFFSKNALDWINSASYCVDTNVITDEVSEYCTEFRIQNNEICVTSSSVIDLYGLRRADDIDCITTNRCKIIDHGRISSHESEKKYYSQSFDDILIKYPNYFVVDGIKFLSLQQLLMFKIRRHECPKDYKDIFLICVRKNGKKILNFLKTKIVYIPLNIIKQKKKQTN